MNKDKHRCYGCTWGTRTGDKYFCMIPGPMCWRKVGLIEAKKTPEQPVCI